MLCELRPTGLPVVGNVPWGTHLCHFYRSGDDLIGSLVAYIQAGLANNERCICITREPLTEAAVRDAAPNLDRAAKSGQLEIRDRADWSRSAGGGAEQTIRWWLEREEDALRRG